MTINSQIPEIKSNIYFVVHVPWKIKLSYSLLAVAHR